ncbi:MAG: hypothetical protein HOK71_12085 [Planctomycetaceae bacterium]|jgi:hypothetical protein|nr:hypothetical protein [Planctomycetaceae bacterium]MBT6485385.1 hypothetical protein [Planctomycetaceae bacterium]
MSIKTHYTVGEVAELYGIPNWKIRRVADSLGDTIPRVGQYRLIDRSTLGAIAAELSRQGWLPSPETKEATACQ